jgi:hypothetical protein
MGMAQDIDAPVPERSEEYVYGHLLETITGGLYPNKMDVIREYVQNAYDAIREVINEAPEEDRESLLETKRIMVHLDSNSIFINDNATGMNYETLNEYRKIGYSKKVFGDYAGWRGIGKAAGFSVADKLIVSSSIGDGKTHILTFNSKEMLEKVYGLRDEGKNILLGKLIQENSEINTIEMGMEPFTTVELHHINEESMEIYDIEEVKTHLASIAPVPFSEEFEYKNEIESELRLAIEDYTPIKLCVNGIQIYKPYRNTWVDPDSPGDETKVTTIERPNFVDIYDEENEELIGFAWYCKNSTSGQITTEILNEGMGRIKVGGLVFRVDDIKIGNSDLTRSTIWYTSTHLSLYSFGEVHVLDKRVEPSSDRNDFVDNNARYGFYQECASLVKEINRKARKTSKESNAEKKISQAEGHVASLAEKIENKEVPKELLSSYIYKLEGIKQDITKRKDATPDADLKKKADKIVENSVKMLEQLTTAISKQDEEITEDAIYVDTPKKLKMNKEGQVVYETIVGILREYYYNESEVFEEILTKIRVALEDVME